MMLQDKPERSLDKLLHGKQQGYGGKEYFNEGTWNETTNMELDDYGRQIRLSYAFIEYLGAVSGPARAKVRIKQWHGLWKPESDMLL